MKIQVTTITRSPRGNPMRSTRLVEGDQIRLGRGAECELRLADPRVPLHTRTIMPGKHGAQMYDAFDYNADVTGVYRPQLLTPGTVLKIGPFQLEVAEHGEGVDLALTVELVQPLPGRSRLSADEVYEQARRSPLSKRALSWSLFAVVLAIFLIVPTVAFFSDRDAGNTAQAQLAKPSASTFKIGSDASWNPGELAGAHQPFANNCKTCHSDSFARVQDKDCKACHLGMGDHVNKQLGHVAGLEEVRCASCHRDHKGADGLKQQISHYFMGECSACHKDIKAHLPTTQTENVSDFAKGHPEFRAQFMAGLTANGDALVKRQRLSGKTTLQEQRGLKFPHDVHLDPRGVRGPQGLVKTDCGSCHVPDSSGVNFKPVSMEKHCQSCHELRFEIAAPERQVPHGNVDNVITTMREFYSYLAINHVVLNRPGQDTGARAIPGKAEPGQLRLNGNADVERQVQIAAQEIFERTTCFSCHEIKRTDTAGKPSWEVAPVQAAPAWMPKAKFSHDSHEMTNCSTCHASKDSKSAQDVLMPGIETCRGCHAGAAPERRKIVSNCGMCHGFHVMEGPNPHKLPWPVVPVGKPVNAGSP